MVYDDSKFNEVNETSNEVSSGGGFGGLFSYFFAKPVPAKTNTNTNSKPKEFKFEWLEPLKDC